MQDILTASLEVVTVSFALVMVFDFISGLKCIAQPAQFQSRPQIEPEVIALGTKTLEPLGHLPDPWMLPAREMPVRTQKPAPTEPKPLLLLPQAKEDTAQPPLPTSAKPTLDKLLADVDLDQLQLRPARKIAKLLNISQKLNSKDKPLGFLRAQIKAKLHQSQEIPPQTIEVVRELLAS